MNKEKEIKVGVKYWLQKATGGTGCDVEIT
jgi:hypothetical protein